MSDQAILVASFGTIREENLQCSIGALEKEAQAYFPDRKLYRSWTSNFIRRRLLVKEGKHVDSTAEAVQRMIADGIRDVLVFPAFMFAGKEYLDLLEFFQNPADPDHTTDRSQSWFDHVRIARPLLDSRQDCIDIIHFLDTFFPEQGNDSAVILMGHGTTYGHDGIYTVLEQALASHGKNHVLLGTIDSPEIGFDHVVSRLQEEARQHGKFRRITLMPLLITAGNHVAVDMAGDQPDSWKSRLEHAGYEVSCVLQGMGEFPEIRKLMIQHAADAAEISTDMRDEL
ncbi:MAG: sirohydrochlorin cobaltochelatase [Bilifractor sp.]